MVYKQERFQCMIYPNSVEPSRAHKAIKAIAKNQRTPGVTMRILSLKKNKHGSSHHAREGSVIFAFDFNNNRILYCCVRCVWVTTFGEGPEVGGLEIRVDTCGGLEGTC